MSQSHARTANPIQSFFEANSSVYLFAGAGVGVAAGLPTWKQLLVSLAQTVRLHEIEMYPVIDKRIRNGQYVEAASLYFRSEVPKKEKYGAIRRILRDYELTDSLKCFAELPADGIITTNYDSSLHKAVASQKGDYPADYFYPDPSLSNVQFTDEFFIARIHGRVETPQNIVLTDEAYKELKESSAYRDLLGYLFSHCNLLFIGYSFLDPAIQHVMDTVSDAVGAVQKGQHLALLPNDAEEALSKALSDLNVAVHTYDPSDGHHELWEMVCAAHPDGGKQQPSVGADPFGTARMYFATCYARYRMGSTLVTLADVIIEGVVVTELENIGKPADIDELAERVAMVVPIRATDLRNKVRGQVFRLQKAGQIRIDGNIAKLVISEKPKTMDDLEILTDGVIGRILIENEGAETESDKNVIRDVIEHTVLSRGWYLSAAFASRDVPDHVSIQDILKGYPLPQGFSKKRLVRAIEGLVANPESRESKALARLGRVAFGLELVLRAPRSALTQDKIFPEEIFLDANVLMPSIVKGHPYGSSYKSSLKRLFEAAAERKKSIKIRTHRIVLNEIISHRRLAISEIENLYRDGEVSLSSQALYQGLENMNVFVAGFVETCRDSESEEFESYLRKYAPYSTEKALEDYLRKNTHVELFGENRQGGGDEYAEILHELEVAYSKKPFWERKDAELIRHDAIQLAFLNAGVRSGKRCLFVTADKALRNAVADGRYADLANYMISHVGLVNLVELVVAARDDEDADMRSSAKLLWGVGRTDHAERIRRFFINRALREHDAALAAKMGDIVDDVTEDVVIEARRRDIELGSTDFEQRRKSARLFEEFEDEFFARMNKAVQEFRDR